MPTQRHNRDSARNTGSPPQDKDTRGPSLLSYMLIVLGGVMVIVIAIVPKVREFKRIRGD
jgi:hypothetical protein